MQDGYFYDRHRNYICGIANEFARTYGADADDLFGQTVYELLLIERGGEYQYRSDDDERSFVSMVSRRVMKRMVDDDAARRRAEEQSPYMPRESNYVLSSPESSTIAKLSVTELSVRQLKILEMSMLCKMTCEAAALKLGVHRNTVGSDRHAIVKKLSDIG